MLLPGEKRRIIVARQGTYKKNTKPCNVQVYNCGSQPSGSAVYQPCTVELSYLALNRFHGGRCPSLRFSGFAFAWLVATLRQPSPALVAAQRCEARVVGCGGGGSPPYFIRWKNMDRDHGAQSQRRSPLAKKRARIVITLPPPPSCRPAAARRARLPAGSGRPEPKRQLETTAEVSGETWSLETLVAPLHAIKGQDWRDLMGRQPTWRSKVCRRVRLERTQPYLPTFLPNLPLP